MNPYDPYLAGSFQTASPVELVRMLYRFVIDCLRDASRSTLNGDIQGRGQAVSKANEGLMELLTSLDHERGGDVSRSLGDLYAYMASRILQGHMDQDHVPFDEAEKLMSTLLEGWENVADGAPVPTEYAPVSVSF